MSNVIEVVDRTGCEEAPAPVIALVKAVLEAENAGGAVTVVFVDEEEMIELNGRFRGLAEPTDVLSFRYADGAEEWPAEVGDGWDLGRAGGEASSELDLGEVVVCPAVVGRYAREESAEYGGRLAWTLVHGVLHLIGYDHEKDEGEMRRRERRLLRELAPLVRAFQAEDR